MKKNRIVLVDDHAILREGLASMLAHFRDMEVIGEAQNGCEAVEKVLALEPDVVIMDIAMPEMNGLEATKRILKERPQTRVLVLTQHEEPQYVLPIIEAGAAGLIPKSALGDELIQAIRTVATRDSFLSPSIARTLVKEIQHKTEHAAAVQPALTGREAEVLRHIALGESNSEIALALSLSVRTVEWHRLHIMEKINVHHVAGLVRFALAHGYIKEEELAQTAAE